MAARQRTDYAEGYCLAHAEGVANSQYDIAHLGMLTLSDSDGGQLGQINFDHREIGLRISADHLGFGAPVVGECDFNFIGGFDYVRVGEDVALVADDDAGAEIVALLRLALAFAFPAEEIAEHRVIHERCALRLDFFAGVNIDHGGHGALGGIAERGDFCRGQRGSGGRDGLLGNGWYIAPAPR